MNNFWTLVGFEYKKIFARKSVFIAILAAIFVITFTSATNIIGTDTTTGKSYYDEMLLEKEYKSAFNGKALTGELIFKAAQAFAKVPTDNYAFTQSDEYFEFAKPYESIFRIVDSAYTNKNNAFLVNDFGTLSLEQANNYYKIRSEQYRLNLENNPLFTDKNIERVMEIDNEVVKPFTLQYHEGYRRFLNMSSVNALCIMILVCFILSPLFSDEHQKKTDSLILTSKNGKRSFIKAKIFTAFSCSAAITLLILAVAYLICMLIYGFDGFNASLQNMIGLVTYNFTLAEVILLLTVTTIFGSFLMMSITLFFSSCTKPITCLMLSLSVVVLGLFNGLTMEWFVKLRMFLPTAMGIFDDIITQLTWSILGADIWSYQAVCMVAFVVGSVLLLLTSRNFKRHQVL